MVVWLLFLSFKHFWIFSLLNPRFSIFERIALCNFFGKGWLVGVEYCVHQEWVRISLIDALLSGSGFNIFLSK